MEPPVDPKAKPVKKDTKKGQKEVEPELVEMEKDYSGNPMPVIFKHSADNRPDDFSGFEYPRPFFKYFNEKSDSFGEEAKTAVPVLEHSPVGAEVDSYVCCAFRSVKRFAPAIIASQNDDSFSENYLWRGIYPKLKTGKPCFNPAGKYCVRLFLAGKWRKVYVDDVIPLRDDGRPALATSSDPLELWPLLLSKAIYTVYSACGYSTLIDDVETSAVKITMKDLMRLVKSNQVTIPHKICSFVSFTIHVLTGWQPTSPMSVTSIFLNEKTRSIKLLMSITAAGVIEIDEDDFIDHSSDKWDPHALPEANTGAAAFLAGSSNEDGEEGLILKTKKRFQEEYQVRKERMDAMLESIAIRESKISRIQAAMNLSLSEVFLVVVFDRTFTKWRVLPILGICYPKTGSGSLNNVKILVDWKTGAPVPDPKSESSIKAKLSRPDEFPLPSITPLRCEWTSIDALMKGNAYIIAMDTLIKTPYHTSWSRHWVPAKPLAAPEPVANGRSKSPPKKSTKEAKASTPSTTTESSSELICVDPGMPPITLLRLDISQFYHMVEVDANGNEREDGEDLAGLTHDNNEMAAAVEEQAKELGAYSSSSKDGADTQPTYHLALKPKKGYLTLSVLLHGDLTTSPHNYSPVETAAAKKEASEGKNILPSDVVLILQVNFFWFSD